MFTSITQKSVVGVILSALLALIIGMTGYVFFSGEASKAELAFAEHSLLGKQAGAVIPASCNSIPPFSHFGGANPDCSQMCALSGNPDVRNNTQYSAASNSCVCTNGKTNPPNCDRPITEIAFKGAGAGATGSNLKTLILSISADKQEPRLGTPITLTWSVTGGDASCRASGNWSGLKQKGGTESVTIKRCTQTDYPAKYSLSCTNNATGVTEDTALYIKYKGLSSKSAVCSCQNDSDDGDWVWNGKRCEQM